MTGPRNPVRRLAIPSIAIVCAASLLAGIGGSTEALSASAKPAVGAEPDTAAKATTTTTPSKAPGGGGASSGTTALPVGVGDPHATSSASVTFTPNTVVITPSQVTSSLRSVSADGSTYTFSNSSGKLGELARGKVMLLEGFDAAVVTGVQHSGSSLVVTTSPAELSDIVQSGSIHVDAPPDYSDAFGTDTSDASAGSSDSTAAWSPTAGGGPVVLNAAGAGVTAHSEAVLDSPRLGASVRPEAVPDGFTGHGWQYTGHDPTGKFTYSISLVASAAGLQAYGGFCYSSDGSGNVSGTCGGPLSLSGQLNGTVSWSNAVSVLDVAKGQPPKGNFSLSGLTFKLHVTYTALRKDGTQIGAKLPPFNLPFSFEMPVCPPPAFCGGVPLYTKNELSLLLTLGISSKDAVIQGGFTMLVSGPGSVVDQSGFKVLAGSSSSFHLSGKFDPGTSVTLGASAVEVALQDKVSLGLGIKWLNAMFYIALIAAIGQVTGSEVASEFCQNFYATFTIKGGAEVQLWIFKVPLVAVTLWTKSEKMTQAPC
jgi:hypothetical protein